MTAPTLPAPTSPAWDCERTDGLSCRQGQDQPEAWCPSCRRWYAAAGYAPAPSTAPADVAASVDMWRRDGTNTVVALACDLIDALAADRDDAFARMIATERRANTLAAELAAMRERAERAEAYVHDLAGCEWPGCDQPSTTYRISSSWEGRLCECHNDRPALFPKESHDA